MTYTKWREDWRDEADPSNPLPGATSIDAGFLDQVENTFVSQDTLITSHTSSINAHTSLLNTHDDRIDALETDPLTITSADGSGGAWKLLVFSDRTVKAVPSSAVFPAAPTGLAVTPRLSFVTLTWNAVSGASSYRIYRNGSFLLTSSLTQIRDGNNIVVNSTYTYHVIAVNSYDMWSPSSSTIQAFISPSLNVAPVFESITIWPTNPRPNDKVYVRVNGHDVDSQILAVTLGVDEGSLTSTVDPTTWIWQEI